MDGHNLELAMNSRNTGAGREPDAIRHEHDDERCPIVHVWVDPPAYRQPADLLSLLARNGLVKMRPYLSHVVHAIPKLIGASARNCRLQATEG